MTEPTSNTPPTKFRLRRPDEGPTWFYRLAAFTVRTFSQLWCRIEVHDAERIPATGAVVIVPTHNSYLDPPFVGGNMGRAAYYLARDTLFKVPILGMILRNLQVYPVKRGAGDREALRASRRVLEAGWPMLFFPEGTRSRDGRLGPLLGGYIMAMEGLDIPYVPVNIQSTFKALPRGALFPRPRKVHMYVGEPRKLPVRNEGERAKDYIARCLDQLREDYKALGVE